MRNVRILIAVIAVFLLVVPAALAQVKPPQPSPVPNVAGMPLNIAQKALVSAGFNAVVTHEDVKDPGKNNIVLKQQVAPGTALAKGSMVPVVVGRYTAPAQQTVPNVVGMPLDRAQATLSQAKLNAAVTTQPVDQPQRNNVVLAQNVPAGKTLPPGSMVPVVVGRYTAPAQQTVPNVVGMPLARAQATLSQSKLNAAVTMQPVDQPQRNNVVLTQNVPAGKTLTPGSMVPVVVGRYTPPARVNVPYVTGKPLAEAQKILAGNKLNAEVTTQPVAEPQRNGVVLGQKLAAGTPVSPGAMVPVVVGRYTPPARVNVPNITGKPLAEAQKILAGNKLNAEVTMQPVAEPQRNGVVLGQKLAVGTPVTPGSMVPVVVGKYAPPAMMAVPSVTGMPLAMAQKALAANKMNAVVSQEKVTDKNKANIVLKQQVAPGTKLAPGSQVPLIVGRYEAPARVPNVVGMNWAQAKTMLIQAKLAPSFSSRTTNDKQKNNIVLEQNVRAGTDVAPGSQVNVVVGRYKTTAEMVQEIQGRSQSNVNQPIPPDNR